MLKWMFSVAFLVGFSLASPGADHKIDQSNKTFSTAEITIRPGDRITFKK